MGSSSKKKTRFINPPNVFKKSVGGGGIDPQRLGQAQDYISTIKIDYASNAKRILKDLESGLKDYRKTPKNKAIAKENILNALIRLKASGGMFEYPLITAVSDIALQFLDSIDDINKDLLNVLDAHSAALKAIIARGLKGSGGPDGHAILSELEKACQRYFDKYGGR